jgi:hypothetical protein
MPHAALAGSDRTVRKFCTHLDGQDIVAMPATIVGGGDPHGNRWDELGHRVEQAGCLQAVPLRAGAKVDDRRPL